MSIKHISAGATPEAVADIVRAEGAAIVDRLAPPELIDRIADEMRPWFAATPYGSDPIWGLKTRRTGALIARSPASHQLIMHPLALGVAGVLLAHATKFQLHLTQAIAIGGGQPAQALHRDQWAFDFFPFPKGYEVQCNTIWAMTDFTESNGATRVVLGSNTADDGHAFQPTDSEPAVMERGSVLFYSGSVFHGGGANDTETPRVGLNITYNLAWLRQEENQYLSVPRELASTLPADLLRLMGYERGAFGLGYIDDLRDPIEAVRPGLDSMGLTSVEAAATAAERRDVGASTR